MTTTPGNVVVTIGATAGDTRTALLAAIAGETALRVTGAALGGAADFTVTMTDRGTGNVAEVSGDITVDLTTQGVTSTANQVNGHMTLAFLDEAFGTSPVALAGEATLIDP